MFETDDVLSGFSDEALESLCELEDSRAGIPNYKLITGREFYWAAELYSFGRAIRTMAGLPRWMPIPANLEHGVDHRTFLEGDQHAQRARYFLAWQKWRAKAEEQTDKKIFLTMHPMVALRQMLGIRQIENPAGTLIFVPHGDIDSSPVNAFSDSLKEFRDLPKQYHPLVLCVQMRDIEKGLHKDLREHRLPIVTAGHINSPWFADRFYSIVRNFAFASSTDVGSHVFLTEEMGVHFFLVGDTKLRKKERAHELERWPHFASVVHRLEHWEEIFSEFPPKPSVRKEILLDRALGTDTPLSVHRRRLRRLLYREILLNAPNMVFEGSKRMFRRFKRRLLKSGPA